MLTCCMLSHFSLVRLFKILWAVEPTRLLCPWDSLGKNTGVGCHALLQGIFQTHRSNQCLLHLLHWQADSLPLVSYGETPQPPGDRLGDCFFFPFIFISWRLITSQHFSGFCHTLTWISHGVTCIPHPNHPSHLPLHPIPRAWCIGDVCMGSSSGSSFPGIPVHRDCGLTAPSRGHLWTFPFFFQIRKSNKAKVSSLQTRRIQTKNSSLTSRSKILPGEMSRRRSPEIRKTSRKVFPTHWGKCV